MRKPSLTTHKLFVVSSADDLLVTKMGNIYQSYAAGNSIRLKLYENCAFPENFLSGKLGDIKIFYMQF